MNVVIGQVRSLVGQDRCHDLVLVPDADHGILLAFVRQSKIAAAAVAAQDDWKKEFEDICSQTEDSMSLSPDELKGLVDRCEALKPRIEKLDETQRKVYLKRLQMCRDHLVFVIESKSGK